MQVLERTKREIETKAASMSDFLRMEYLESCIRKFTDVEILRYCYQELSRLYEGRSMFTESLKYIAKYKELCVLQKERQLAILKEMDILVKAGYYDRADLAFKDAIREVTDRERFEVKRKIVDLLKAEAKKFEMSSKNSGLIKVYEHLVNYLTDAEKIEIKRKMIESYKKLGKVRESIEMERELERNGQPDHSSSTIRYQRGLI